MKAAWAISDIAAEVLPLCQDRASHDLEKLGISPASIESMLAKARASVVDRLPICESPIEEVMLVALGHMVVPEVDCFPPALHSAKSVEPWPIRPVVICPQFPIARYRLDFMVFVNKTWIAVECDGAEHHDTIPGRMRDRVRDTYLEAMGIATLRYSGKWIYRNAERIADEIAAILKGGSA